MWKFANENNNNKDDDIAQSLPDLIGEGRALDAELGDLKMQNMQLNLPR